MAEGAAAARRHYRGLTWLGHALHANPLLHVYQIDFFPYGMIDHWNLFLTWTEIQTLLKGPCIRDGVSGQEGEGKWDTHVLKGEEGENWTGPIRKNAALCCKAKQTHLLFSPNFHEEKKKAL